MKRYNKLYELNQGEFVTQNILEALYLKYQDRLDKNVKNKLYDVICHLDNNIDHSEYSNSEKYEITDIKYYANYKYENRKGD